MRISVNRILYHLNKSNAMIEIENLNWNPFELSEDV